MGKDLGMGMDKDTGSDKAVDSVRTGIHFRN